MFMFGIWDKGDGMLTLSQNRGTEATRALVWGGVDVEFTKRVLIEQVIGRFHAAEVAHVRRRIVAHPERRRGKNTDDTSIIIG